VITQKPNSTSSSVECSVVAQPRNEYKDVYDQMFVRYAKLEDKIVQEAKQ
jgi:hypothetical protein